MEKNTEQDRVQGNIQMSTLRGGRGVVCHPDRADWDFDCPGTSRSATTIIQSGPIVNEAISTAIFG
jgi:hypothetical protein